SKSINLKIIKGGYRVQFAEIVIRNNIYCMEIQHIMTKNCIK
ncbi:13951_t:CDS:1, partial [Ambispora leptoticha]